ncbi:MAG TPA: hypothetical protein VFT19_12150 [Solirubrobacterales bacterium]|nr:hypothetical protein [Solirubrobacterales bacterium]
MSLAHGRFDQAVEIPKLVGFLLGAVVAGLILLGAVASDAAAKEQVGFQVAGEASEEESEQPGFEAESYPAYLNGNGGGYEYGFELGTLSCNGNYSAWYGNQLEEKTPSIALDPFYEFWGCEAFGGSGLTIEANGCRHVLTLLNEGPPYVGEFGVECPTESDYRFNTGSCTISIPPQSALAEVSFANTGEGSSAGVEMTLDVSGLDTSTPVASASCSAKNTTTGR